MSITTVRVLTEYFPSILTVRHMMQHDHILIECGETYQKNSLRNRCHLASSQGRQLLSVPLLKGKHQQQPIRQVKIAYYEDWPSKHLRVLETNYRKAPYYDYFIGGISKILFSKPDFLIDLNWSVLTFLFHSFQWHPLVSCSLDHELPAKHNLNLSDKKLKPYPQLFEDRQAFLPNLSILDLLMCMGPEIKYIEG